MFSLVLTVIAIALAVALVIATIYYGGDVSSKASIRNAATTIVNQASQINAAGVLATAQGSTWPTDSPQFTNPYLSAMPIPPKSAYVTGSPAAADWVYFVADGSTRHFALKGKISKAVCMEVNRAQGLIGIPAVWTGTDLIQCFGAGVPTGPNSELSYTFFHAPIGMTPAQDAAALAQSTTEAIAGGAAAPKAGYPRLCPDGSNIATGVCPDVAVVEAPPAPPATGDAGYFVVTGSSGAYTDPLITSNGFSATCPTGAIDPTGPNATPVVTSPGETFNVDASIRAAWQTQPDEVYTDTVTRTWCFPALKSEALAAGDMAWKAPSGMITGLPFVSPDGNSYALTAATTFTMKGQQWSVIASSFSWFPSDGEQPYMEGTKLAVGKVAGATYVGDILSAGGYPGVPGKITYDLTAPFQKPAYLLFSPSYAGVGGTYEVGDRAAWMPDIFTFPSTTVAGTSSPILTVNVTNTGGTAYVFGKPVDTFDVFPILYNTCYGTLAPGASCAVKITYSPVESGSGTTGWMSFYHTESPNIDTGQALNLVAYAAP